MKELIKIEEKDGKQTVNARELHSFLEIKSEFRNWIKNRIEKWGFTQGVDFISGKFLPDSEQIDYYISFDMAKELAMVENNEQGRKARRYFIECEKELKEIENNLSPTEILLKQVQRLVDFEKRQKETEKRLELIEAKQETSQSEFFTIAGYCSLKNMKISLSKANILGRKCSKLSRELEYDIGKINDQRYGQVNTYHIDVLNEIIE